MTLSFGKKLLISYWVVVGLTLGLTGLYLHHRLEQDALVQVEEALGIHANLLWPQLSPALRARAPSEELQRQIHAWDRQARARLTLVGPTGRVLADSERTLGEVRDMDNHADRPEIRQAREKGFGTAIRHSHTLNSPMVYVAKGGPEGVLRLSLSLKEAQRRIAGIQKDLWKGGGIALVLTAGLAWVISLTVRRPLRAFSAQAEALGAGQSVGRLPENSRDEFGKLARSFNRMARQIEAQVRELTRDRTQLSAILAGLVEGVLALDPEGRFMFCNAAAGRLFQVDPEALPGRYYYEAIRQNALQEMIRGAFEHRQMAVQEIVVHSPEERILAARAVPLDQEGRPIGMLVTVHDLTELRRMERIRQEFVTNVTHELKTPLTAIQCAIETLAAGALRDPVHAKEFLGIIEGHTARLGHLIDNVLKLSAIESQRVSTHFEPVSPQEVLEPLLKGLGPLAQAKKVRMEIALGRDCPRVLADRDKLAQILLNLLDNAIKFNKENGLVQVSAEVNPGHLTLVIRDTGVGIPPEDQPRVFERFYRVDKARSRQAGGTGLGLAIVKHLVELHQGTITLQSIPGEGSTFRVSLPLA